jgi:hypothetical protein
MIYTIFSETLILARSFEADRNGLGPKLKRGMSVLGLFRGCFGLVETIGFLDGCLVLVMGSFIKKTKQNIHVSLTM